MVTRVTKSIESYLAHLDKADFEHLYSVNVGNFLGNLESSANTLRWLNGGIWPFQMYAI